MPEADAENTPYNPFDLTKVWPHADYPPIDVGVMELNRNAENYFAEIENAAFSPSNIVPGIGFSPDKMLQARVFSYADAHRHRLGTHYETIPVNQPRCPVHHYHRDGQMNVYGGIKTGNPDAYYEPNSVNGPFEDKSAQEPPLRISGDAARYDHREGNDDFGQPRALFNLFDDGQKARLFANIAAAMGGIPEEIAERQIALFDKVHPDYGAGVRKARAEFAGREPAIFGNAGHSAAGRRVTGRRLYASRGLPGDGGPFFDGLADAGSLRYQAAATTSGSCPCALAEESRLRSKSSKTWIRGDAPWPMR